MISEAFDNQWLAEMYGPEALLVIQHVKQRFWSSSAASLNSGLFVSVCPTSGAKAFIIPLILDKRGASGYQNKLSNHWWENPKYLLKSHFNQQRIESDTSYNRKLSSTSKPRMKASKFFRFLSENNYYDVFWNGSIKKNDLKGILILMREI